MTVQKSVINKLRTFEVTASHKSKCEYEKYARDSLFQYT